MSKAAAIEDYLARLKDSPVSLDDFDRITISLPKDKAPTPPAHPPASAPAIHWLTLAITFAAGLAIGTSVVWLL